MDQHKYNAKKVKKSTAIGYEFKKDYAEMFANPEDLTLKNLLGLIFVGHHKVAGDSYRKISSNKYQVKSNDSIL